MADWLSSTWEANWRSFQYFNIYRLVLAGLFCLAILVPSDWSVRLHLHPSAVMFGGAGIYMLATMAGVLLAIHWQYRFNLQLTAQVMVDIVLFALLTFHAEGVSSGLSVLLLVSLAAASLVGRGRLVLLYAAVATVAVLLGQYIGVLLQRFEHGTMLQAGLICTGFFATAILARLLGQRVMANEDLARRRGIALDNQVKISQRVVESVQDGVLIVTRDGHLLHSNPMARSLLGITGDVSSGVPLISVAAVLDEGLSQWRTNSLAPDRVRFRGGDGAELQARFERTSSSDGELLVFLEDLGRIREKAQQLKLASLGRLTASIAHEIRNPLSAIGHAGELLREERRGEMQERLLRILHDNVIRLDRIVKDILDLGRQSRAEPELLQLDEFCIGFMEHFVAAEGVDPDILKLEVSGPASLCFDRSHLNQVMWNLISNAVRYSSGAAGAVQLLVTRGSDGRVELHVHDDGPGIPADEREQVFEPFFTTHTQGTGLGLYIARELCVTNGATLELLPSSSGAHFLVAGRNDTCQVPESNADLGVN